METKRLEAFADGVFAIAATLLIIDVTADGNGGALGGALAHAWPQYVAYAVSFVTIGIMWVNHHACLDLIARADRRFLFINVALLSCIAFVPFPTRLVAEHLRDHGLRAAALAYGCTMTATAICFFAFWFYAAIGRRLIAPGADERMVRGISRSYFPGAAIYGTATLVALVSPFGSVILFALIAAFYVLESSVFVRGA
ncbi:MAG TPA: TMEM175 family protein [Gaiellaceae bacterium]